jgi:hypothetical protein
MKDEERLEDSKNLGAEPRWLPALSVLLGTTATWGGLGGGGRRGDMGSSRADHVSLY